MIYKAYVIGEDPEATLRPYLAEGNRFVIDLPLRRLCDAQDQSFSADVILDEIKKIVGFHGKIAIVDGEDIDRTCRKLHEAGVVDFMVLTDGEVFTVKRLLERKPEIIEQIYQGNKPPPKPKFFDFTIAQDGLGTGFISRNGSGTLASMRIQDIDVARMERHAIKFERKRHGELGHHAENRDTHGRERSGTYLIEKAWRDILPHAVVTPKGWHERGELGWLGTVENPMSWSGWRLEVERLLAECEPTDKVTIAFCEK